MGDTNLAMWAGGQLAGGAVGAVGSGLLTAGLSQVGIQMPGDNSAALAALKEELDKIVDMVDTVQNQIKNLDAHISQEISQSEFDIRASELEKTVQPIITLTKNYRKCVTASQTAGNSPDTIQRIANDKADIMTQIRDILVPYPSLIHSQVAGGAGTKPLYEVYAELRKGLLRFLSYQDTDAMQARLDYYQNAQYLQQLLLVNYYNAGEGLASGADDAISTFQKNMLEENRFEVMPIIPGQVLDQKTGLRLYVQHCDYVPWQQAKDMPSTGRQDELLAELQWRLPTLAELLSSSKVHGPIWHDGDSPDVPVGIFTGYDSKGGSVSPAQWLMDNGVYQDLSGFHLWTSNVLMTILPERNMPIPMPDNNCHFFVDITDETTLSNSTYACGDDPGHTLLVGNFDSVSTSILITDGDAGYRPPANPN